MATNADVNVIPSKLTTTGATAGYLRTTDGANSFEVVSAIPSGDVVGGGTVEIADDSIAPAKLKRLGTTDGGNLFTPSDIADWYVVCGDLNVSDKKVTAAPDQLGYAKVNYSLIADRGIAVRNLSGIDEPTDGELIGIAEDHDSFVNMYVSPSSLQSVQLDAETDLKNYTGTVFPTIEVDTDSAGNLTTISSGFGLQRFPQIEKVDTFTKSFEVTSKATGTFFVWASQNLTGYDLSGNLFCTCKITPPPSEDGSAWATIMPDATAEATIVPAKSILCVCLHIYSTAALDSVPINVEVDMYRIY